MSVVIATKQLLSDARTAYHDLQTGRAARVVVDQNGERVEFVSANSARLYAYIQQLEAQLGTGCGGAVPDLSGYRPATFSF